MIYGLEGLGWCYSVARHFGYDDGFDWLNVLNDVVCTRYDGDGIWKTGSRVGPLTCACSARRKELKYLE